MNRVWICGACGKPCLLLFWPGVERRDFKGTSCCGSLTAHNAKPQGPTQIGLC